MPKIFLEGRETPLDLNPALSLFNNLGQQGVKLETLCGGRGNCGLCRVKINSNKGPLTPHKKPEKVLLQEHLKDGWRLSCQTFCLNDVSVRLPDYEKKEAYPIERDLANPFKD